MGIPDLKRRTDESETAREWNKMRDAVLSLFNSRPDLGGPPVIGRQWEGFEPYVVRDGGTMGVSLRPGTAHFLQTPIIYAAAGTENRASEVVPTLGGTALDSATPPRTSLAAGDYEAWAIFQERTDGNEVRIEFTTLGTGPGTILRNELCYRLCTFQVLVQNTVQHVRVYDQLVRNQLFISTDNHQFRCLKTGDDTLRVERGNIQWLEGLESPLVSQNLEVARSGDITITGTGSIWLDFTVGLDQHSESTWSSASGTRTFRIYRISSCTSAAYTFRTTRPTPGTNNTAEIHKGSITINMEIAECALDSGEAVVTNQIVDGPIWLPDIADAEVT